MTKPFMSELEWLGFELALERYFFGADSRAMSRILSRLVRRGGITCRFEDLYEASPASLKVRVSGLRSAMHDLGFAARIENIRDCGYRLSETGAREVWERVTTVLHHLEAA